MAVLERRADGEPVKAFQARISPEAYDKLKEYAYKTRQSASLALDELIIKGIQSENREEIKSKAAFQSERSTV